LARQTYSTPLKDIEFDAASDVIKYADLMRAVGRAQQLELQTAADELQEILKASGGNVLDQAKARFKARKVSNYLRRAANDSRGISVMGVQLAKHFKHEYAALISPPKKPNKHTLDWRS